MIAVALAAILLPVLATALAKTFAIDFCVTSWAASRTTTRVVRVAIDDLAARATREVMLAALLRTSVLYFLNSFIEGPQCGGPVEVLCPNRC